MDEEKFHEVYDFVLHIYISDIYTAVVDGGTKSFLNLILKDLCVFISLNPFFFLSGDIFLNQLGPVGEYSL